MNARVECLLEDQGTRSAMEQYISGAGKHANSEGLAQAVADYWNFLGEDSESPALADRDLAPRTAGEWSRRMGYRWVDLKKGVCEMDQNGQMSLHTGMIPFCHDPSNRM